MRVLWLATVALGAALAIACSHGGSKTAAPTPTPTNTPVATETSSATGPAGTPAPRSLQKLPDTLFPGAYTLVVAAAGYGHGHGGYFLLERVYRDGDGVLRREKLFEPKDAGWDNITGIEADERGILFLSLCVGSECRYEGEPRTVRTDFLVSHDGGENWTRVASLDGEWWVRSASDGSAFAVNFAGEAHWKQIPENRDVPAPTPNAAFAGLNLSPEFHPELALDASHIVATVDYERPATCTAGGRTMGADPAVIDLAANTYAFIHEPFYDPACSHGTQRVVAAYRPMAETASPEGFREFAQAADAELARGSIDFLVSRLNATPYTCKPSDVPPGVGGPACEYAGQQFNGFAIGHWHSEGGLYPVENAITLLRRLQDESVPGATDAYGQSRPHIYAIGATDGHYATVVTALIKRPANFAGSGPLRVVEVLSWYYSAGRWRASWLLSAFVMGEEFLQPMPGIQLYVPGWERFPFRPPNAFARVNSGSDCLNVREKPSQSSSSLGCFADGVLLRLRNEPDQSAGGATWVAVETPRGTSGYASSEFLQR